MLVQAKIIDVSLRTHKEKTVADITLIFSNPTQAEVIPMWNNSVSKDEHKPFAALVGHEVLLAVQPELYNGKLQYRLLSHVTPISLVKPNPVAKVG